MITVRRGNDRGFADHGWLKSFHTFSFADYHDAGFMGFRALRVINEDRVAPGRGFPTHPHRDMEIISYVLEGGLRHQDSMGTGSIIQPGDVQRMSAGTGVTHSELNASATDPVHFYQIWIVPDRAGHAPGYAQKTFADSERKNQLRLVASADGRDGSISIHQDVSLFASILDRDARVTAPLAPGRAAWLQVARGSVSVGDIGLNAGDAAALVDETTINLRAQSDAEILLFDLR